MYQRAYVQRRKLASEGERSFGRRAPQAQPAAARSAPESLGSGGQPLDTATRAYMEPRFGHKFADVRVHADSEAHQLAQNFEAHAFTTGQHIYFSNGTYDPRSPAGLHLLAHELTHTIQQARGPVSGSAEHNGMAISDPGDTFERAADVTADRVCIGEAAPTIATGTPGSGMVVQRDADDDELPHVYPSPSSPFNLHLLPDAPLGGGIGYGQPLAPVLPPLEQDPRGIKPGVPDMQSIPSGGPDSGPWSRFGIGIQGRYGDDEKSIGAGFRWNF